MGKRPVIVHFHLFKNAGTSVDKILQSEFGERWIEIEGPDGKKLDTDALVEFIRDNPQYEAISSHTAVVSVPELPDIKIIPILFLRQPVDRIRSAYDFERQQDVETPGAIKAKEGDFAHYMEWRLSSIRPWQIKNFQAFRLKDFHDFTPAKQTALVETRSRAAIDALPFVGLVEAFDTSMARFTVIIQEHFPDFNGGSSHENRTSESMSLDENVKAFEERIGADAYKKLVEINHIDFGLYNIVKDRIASASVSA